MGTRELHTRLMAAYAGPAVRAVLVDVVDWLGDRCRSMDDDVLARRAQAVRTIAASYLVAADDLDAAGLPAPHSTALLRQARERVAWELRGIASELDRVASVA
jgi:hypothetical protein